MTVYQDDRRGWAEGNELPMSVRPESVRGLQAPTNWMLPEVTQALSDVLQKLFCCTSCLRNDMECCIEHLFGAGRFISSPTLFNLFLYSQCCSEVLMRISSEVALERFNPKTSKFGRFFRALNYQTYIWRRIDVHAQWSNTVAVRSIGTVSCQHRVSCPTKLPFCQCQQGGVPKFGTCQLFTFTPAVYRHLVFCSRKPVIGFLEI